MSQTLAEAMDELSRAVRLFVRVVARAAKEDLASLRALPSYKGKWQRAYLRSTDEWMRRWKEADDARVALEEELRSVRLRLGCIARVSAAHDGHVCPADDCLECWPGEVVEEFERFAKMEGH